MNVSNSFIQSAYTHAETDVSDYGNHMFDWNVWSMGGGVFMLIFGVAVILLFVYLVRNISETRSEDSEKERAPDILEKRYAKGEITKKEFGEMKKELMR